MGTLIPISRPGRAIQVCRRSSAISSNSSYSLTGLRTLGSIRSSMLYLSWLERQQTASSRHWSLHGSTSSRQGPRGTGVGPGSRHPLAPHEHADGPRALKFGRLAPEARKAANGQAMSSRA